MEDDIRQIVAEIDTKLRKLEIQQLEDKAEFRLEDASVVSKIQLLTFTVKSLKEISDDLIANLKEMNNLKEDLVRVDGEHRLVKRELSTVRVEISNTVESLEAKLTNAITSFERELSRDIENIIATFSLNKQAVEANSKSLGLLVDQSKSAEAKKAGAYTAIKFAAGAVGIAGSVDVAQALNLLSLFQ